jgi:hypothetical protein
VKKPIVVPDRLRYLFYSRKEVPAGEYEATVDVRRIGDERDIQSLTGLFKDAVTVRVLRTIIE